MEKVKKYYGLIMAGGQGTRFWPWSTEEKPKQFLSIVGKEPLITQTYKRLKHFLREENIFIVADGKYLAAVKEAIPGFKEENFIAEPSPKNTAPCLILANIVLSRADSNANVIVVPADHYIPEVDIFASQFLAALDFAEQKFIITSGIKPDMPHTGYGYINFAETRTVSTPYKGSGKTLRGHTGKEVSNFSRLSRSDKEESTQPGDTEFFNVIEFKEKPELAVAKKYVKAGNYYWNSGMFVYKLRHFKELLAEYSPYYHGQYEELEAAFENKEKFSGIFNNIEKQSIDYALMEKVKEVRMFKARFSWSDVGSWSSVYELSGKDERNNAAARDNSIFIDCRDSLIFSTEEKPAAVIGLEGVTVINTKNGILVAHIDRVQEVKKVLDELKKSS